MTGKWPSVEISLGPQAAALRKAPWPNQNVKLSSSQPEEDQWPPQELSSSYFPPPHEIGHFSALHTLFPPRWTHKKHSFLPTDHNLSTFALHQGVEGSSYACLAFCSHALKNLFSVGTLRDKPSPRRELNFKSTKFYISFVCCASILDADTVNAKPGWCIDISWPYIWVSDPLVKFSACRLLISHSLEENLSFPATSLPRDLNSHPKS